MHFGSSAKFARLNFLFSLLPPFAGQAVSSILPDRYILFQAVPVPKDSVPDVKDTFMQCAESEGIELHEIPKHSDLKQVRNQHCSLALLNILSSSMLRILWVNTMSLPAVLWLHKKNQRGPTKTRMLLTFDKLVFFVVQSFLKYYMYDT